MTNQPKNKIEFENDDEYFAFLDLAWELEKEWKKSLPKMTAMELLEVFPEAKNVIKPKISEWMEEREQLVKKIKAMLLQIRTIKDPFARDLQKYWLKLTYGEQLLEIDKHLSRLRHLLAVAKGRPPSKGGVTEEMIEQALSVPIETVISQQLRKSGDKLVGLCPLHNERTPSFFVYPESNSFYCYGCGVGGNVINLIKQTHNFNFVEAVKLLNNQ